MQLVGVVQTRTVISFDLKLAGCCRSIKERSDVHLVARVGEGWRYNSISWSFQRGKFLNTCVGMYGWSPNSWGVTESRATCCRMGQRLKTNQIQQIILQELLEEGLFSARNAGMLRNTVWDWATVISNQRRRCCGWELWSTSQNLFIKNLLLSGKLWLMVVQGWRGLMLASQKCAGKGDSTSYFGVS